MAFYKQDSSKEQNVNGQRIQDVEIKPGDKTPCIPHSAKKGGGVTTISKIDVGAVIAFTNVSGYLGIELAAPVEEGTYVSVSNAGWPVDGSYYVVDVVGNIAVTDFKYHDCFASASGATAATCDGEIFSYEDANLSLFADDRCSVPTGACKENKSTGEFISRVYTECWECFDGQLDPCDVSVETFQWWKDDSCDKDRAISIDGCEPFAENNSKPGDDNPDGENKS